MLSSSVMSRGTKLTRLNSSSSDATALLSALNRGPVLSDSLPSNMPGSGKRKSSRSRCTQANDARDWLSCG